MNKEKKWDELSVDLNGQTGLISWPELERHFARGVVLKVSDSLDLVETGAVMVRDNKTSLEEWIKQELVCYLSDEDAKRWLTDEPELWALAVAPWVLVQEKKPG